jgi:hypothetical protein
LFLLLDSHRARKMFVTNPENDVEVTQDRLEVDLPSCFRKFKRK